MDDHRQSGYSLFELMLVLALMSLFAGLAAPSFSHYIERTRLHSATETIASDFRYTRIQAIQTGKIHYINFGQEGAKWCYSSDAEKLKTCSSSGKSSKDFMGIKLEKLAFGNKQTITFSPVRGISRNGRLTLSTASGNSASIIVSPLGRIRVCSDQTSGYAAC